MEILVVGGTGTVGNHAVRNLVERGERPRVLTREPGNGDVRRADYVPGALGDADSLHAALEGIEAVLLITPLHPQEGDIGVAAVGAMDGSGVERIVLQSVQRADTIPDASHFAAKVRIVDAIERTAIPHTVIAPNSFVQNDLRLRDAILNGVYPLPFGSVGLSRVDARDVADAHVRALLEVPAEGRTYVVAGPEVWTAGETAAVWGRVLERDVVYGGDDLDAYAEALKGAVPDWMVEDLVAMYAAFQERGLVASEEEREASREIVGHSGRTFEAFAKETAAEWASQPT